MVPLWRPGAGAYGLTIFNQVVAWVGNATRRIAADFSPLTVGPRTLTLVNSSILAPEGVHYWHVVPLARTGPLGDGFGKN
jgi:hypothetical protein